MSNKEVETKEYNDDLRHGLEERFGPAIAQEILDEIEAAENRGKNIDYMQVKELSELSEKYRAQAMMAVWRLKEWRRKKKFGEALAEFFAKEGRFLEEQAVSAVRLYREANHNYHALYQAALTQAQKKSGFAGV